MGVESRGDGRELVFWCGGAVIDSIETKGFDVTFLLRCSTRRAQVRKSKRPPSQLQPTTLSCRIIITRRLQNNNHSTP